MRRTLAVAAVLLAGLVVAACNTVEGVGEDVSAVGEGVAGAANETGKAISGEK